MGRLVPADAEASPEEEEPVMAELHQLQKLPFPTSAESIEGIFRRILYVL